MSYQLIDGKSVAATVLQTCRAEVELLKSRGIHPGLAVVLVGDDPASHAYVRNKVRTCADIGVHSEKIEMPATTSQAELLAVVERLNHDPRIHGILVQSPPPPQIDETAIVCAIDPAKDVDGFHPVNVAKLAMEDATAFVPCTPLGCQRLLVEAGIPIEGSRVVILGRSMIVGKTLALLLMQKSPQGNATVTVVHSRSNNIPEITKAADIVIAAIGRANFVTADMVREGAVVIDVGINRLDDADRKSGFRLVGDVDFGSVAPKCSAITPVPGGVGPMTIAMLMENTLKAARHFGSKMDGANR